MKTELAVISVLDDDDVALIRNKAYGLGKALGVSAIKSSQLASRVSEYCRGLKGGCITVVLENCNGIQHERTCLYWNDGDWSAGVLLPGWPEQSVLMQQQQMLKTLSRPAMLRDLHEKQNTLKQQQADLEKKNRDLEEATRLKSEFLANMSHELRTPMNSIIGFTGRVLKKAGDQLSERHLKNLKIVERNAHHLLGLINSLLDLSKIEAGKMDVFVEEFAIDDLFDEVMELTDSLVSNKGISIKADTPPDPVRVYTDKTKLKQILINLVSNAVKFTDEGGVTLRARLIADSTIEIRVIDTGVGMKPEALDYIFDAFRQVDGSNTRNYGGTGLGLNITSRFCEMLGGKVTVESKEDMGSTFIVTLPLSYRPEAIEISSPDMTETDESAVETESEADLAQGVGSVVLCIDDNHEVLELLSEYLTEAGYQPVCADNGADGVSKARQLQPVAITLDVQMPYQDGWSVLKQLKNDPLTRDIPVLMATMMENKALGFELGAYDYLEKPIMPENLIRSLESVPSRVRHVLVVDDDASVRELMLQTLQDQGIVSTLAIDGLDAIEQIERMGEKLPDLVILDLMMPRMDGFAVLEKLSTHEQWRHIPVIVSTAKSLSRDEKIWLASKTSNLVQKGGNSLDKLVSLIHQ